MTEQRAKGTISTAKAEINDGVGKLTGNREQQAKGKVQQVKGAGQKGLAAVEDAVAKVRRD